MDNSNIRYAGFWIRFAALLIDSIWMTVVIYGPLVIVIWLDLMQPEGNAYLAFYIATQWIIPALIVLFLWSRYQATPGKIACGIKVVDSVTFERASLAKYTVRYIGYIISMIPLFLGYFWAGWDKKKRGFHDMMSKTVVVYSN